MTRRTSLLRGLFLMMLGVVAAPVHSLKPAPPPPIGQQLLLERRFDALKDTLENQAHHILARDGPRLFGIALGKLGIEGFIRLYQIAPAEMSVEAMAVAVRTGRVDALEALAANGMDLNAVRSPHGSVMTIAARKQKFEIMSWALKTGVRPLPVESEINELAAASETLYSRRIVRSDPYPDSPFRWLETRGFQPSVHPIAMRSLLGQLVRFGNLELLDRYVQFYKSRKLFDPNMSQRGIPLVYAAETLPVLKYLEAEGAALDVPSLDQRGAVYRTNLLENHQLDGDAKLYLLAKGLRPTGAALSIGASIEPADIELIEAFLQAGADPNREYLCAPLHCIAKWTDTNRLPVDQARKVISLLLRFGADLNKLNAQGELPLHVGLWRCSWPAIQLWLDAGYDINVTHSKTGRTLIGLLTQNGMQRCRNKTAGLIQALVKAGADPNAGTPPPLFDLVTSTYAVPTDVVGTLIDLGADVNVVEPGRGDTLLHRLVTAPLKLKERCYPAYRRKQPCLRESLEERVELIRYMVARGADPDRRNSNGLNAFDQARQQVNDQRRIGFLKALGEAVRER